MKKIILTLFLSLLLSTSLLTAKLVSAHHNTITQTASCSGYTVKADYVGGNDTRRVLTNVVFKLDGGIDQNIASDWRGASNGFNIFTRTGTGNHEVKATGTVKLYSCDEQNDDLWTQSGIVKCDAGGSNNSDDGWDLVETDTFNLDYKGSCATSTPSPTVIPTPTVTPSPIMTPTGTPTATSTMSPSPTPSQSPEPTETPVPSETPTPTPSPEVKVETPLTEAGTSSCPITAPAKIPNIYVVNAGKGKLEVRWMPTGGNKAHILYGAEAGKPQHSLIDTDNDGVEVISSLNSGQHYWFSVVNGSDCSWSSPSDWYDPIVE